MTKAVFLDRDGTMNEERHYLHRMEDFVILPGVIEGMKLLQDAGYLLIIVTNQSGIGRGYYSEEDFINLNDWMLSLLREKGIQITKVYYCPHLPDARLEKYRKVCTCRKPELGMFEQAIQEFDIDLARSFAIGDKIRDCALCESTACRGFLIADNEKPKVIQSVKAGMYRNIQYGVNLLECAKEIIAMEE